MPGNFAPGILAPGIIAPGIIAVTNKLIVEPSFQALKSQALYGINFPGTNCKRRKFSNSYNCYLTRSVRFMLVACQVMDPGSIAIENAIVQIRNSIPGILGTGNMPCLEF